MPVSKSNTEKSPCVLSVSKSDTEKTRCVICVSKSDTEKAHKMNQMFFSVSECDTHRKTKTIPKNQKKKPFVFL